MTHALSLDMNRAYALLGHSSDSSSGMNILSDEQHQMMTFVGAYNRYNY